MITLLAIRNIVYRPWRSLLLFFGYGVGVGVMIVLLAIGEALLTQARDERLVGGGEVTVLPEGLDVEVMKTGGIGGLFFSIDHSRFIQRQLLGSPRISRDIRAVAPQIEGKLLYVRTRDGRETPVRAFAEIPNATRAVGAPPGIISGAWRDDDGDRRFVSPTITELRHEIDHFHLPPANIANADSWAEWHYFNVLSADRQRWAFMSFIVGGDIRGGQWGGRVAITLLDQNGHERRYATVVPSPVVRFSTTDADLTIGTSSVTVLSDGRYAIKGSAVAEHGQGIVTVDLTVSPAPGAYFPGASLGGDDFVSGYVVPGIRASATGTICENKRCEQFAGAQSYHDHNWGVWRGVTWDWGASRAGAYTILYGRVIPPDGSSDTQSLFVYLVDSLGFRAVFRPRQIDYVNGRTITVAGRSVHVPTTATFTDTRGRDTLTVRLDIEHAIGTDTRAPLVERGSAAKASASARPYFIQMKGTATISGRVGGDAIAGTGTGFFETYRAPD